LTLFDPSPKSSAKDLYGRAKELGDLVHYLDDKRWVVLLGPRRIGKTSLARCALSKTKVRKSIVIDARDENDLAKALALSLTPTSRLSKLKIGGGLGLASASLDIAREFTQVTTIGKLLESAGKVIILIDESERLRNPKRVSSLLAHIYDYHYDNVTLIITGSTVGVMKSITEPSSKSPLYGRAMTTMEIQRWSGSVSLGFLKAGFTESRVKYREDDLSSVVERLDGIPGWLTLFGYRYSRDQRSSDAVLRKTISEALKIIKDELESISKVSLGWKRQLSILKEIARGPKRFSEIGRDLGINNTALSHNLDVLQRLGYVSKQQRNGEYAVIDPLVAEYLA
jgi:AAA+ ATPase superfamily predicted ATPase